MRAFPLFILVLWLSLHLAAAWWSKDLAMNNAEALFMNRAATEHYHSFREQVGERRVLAAKIDLDHDMTAEDYDALRSGIAKLKQTFMEPAFQWLDFQTTYQKKLGDGSFSAARSFWLSEPHLILPLFGERHAGTVVLMDGSMNDVQVNQLVDAIQRQPELQRGKLSLAGLPWVNLKLNEYATDIKLKLMPLMFAVCALLVLIMTRSLLATLLLILPSVFALSSTMALIKLMYGSLNMITAVVPLRVFVINLTLGFYVYFAAIHRGSLQEAIRAKWRPLALGVVATALGFGSNAVSSIPAVRELAIVAMIAVVFAAVSSLMALWFMGQLFATKGLLKPTLFHRIQAPLPRLSGGVQRNWFVGTILAAIVAGSQIFILTDATQYFPKSSGIKEALNRVEQDFLGTPVFEVMITKPDGSDFSFENYTALVELEQKILNEMGAPYKILSLNTLATEANRLFSGSNTMPSNRFAWVALMGGLSEQVKASFPTGKLYRVSLLGTAMNHEEFLHREKNLRQVLQASADRLGYHYDLNGLNYSLMQSQESLLQVLSLSFLGSLAVIILVFGFFFRNHQAILRFAATASLPALVGLILIPLLGFSLNIATVMSFGVSLGMVVSNLIHLAWEQRKRAPPASLHEETLLPMLAATVVLTISFALFGLNDFLPIHQEGILVALILASAGVAALLSRPA